MAMLAERRRKTKFVLTPVAKPLWTQEDNGMQFGKKMMEKMGWSAGKGLGASEQGMQEPLRAIYKQDSKGMGYNGHGNPFENLDQFNALLSSLSGSAPEDVVHSFESLEEKSKHSKARVHYKKFTRGKDLSKCSKVDLTCIVGSGKKPVEEEVVEEIEDKIGETDKSHGVTTIHGGSISDYFKSKLEKISRVGKNNAKEKEAAASPRHDEGSWEGLKISEEPDHQDQSDTLTFRKKKKKSKHSTKEVDDNTHLLSNSDVNKKIKQIEEEAEEVSGKKRKVSEPVLEEIAEINDHADINISPATDEDSSLRKKKKKHKKCKDLIQDPEQEEMPDTEPPRKKKKDRKRDKYVLDEANLLSAEEPNVEAFERKRSKKDKRKHAENGSVEETIKIEKEKKKKKRRKDKEEELITSAIDDEAQKTQNKRKRKREDGEEKTPELESVENEEPEPDIDMESKKEKRKKKKEMGSTPHATPNSEERSVIEEVSKHFKGSNLGVLAGYANKPEI